MAARYLLYSVLALAIGVSIWMGLRRMAWDAAYQTVGLIAPAQELDSSLSDDELRTSLAQMRAQGIVALSIELSDFPEWSLRRATISDDVVRVLHAAQAVGLGVAFIINAEHSSMPLPAIRPDLVVVVSEHGSVVPSWVVTGFRDAILGIIEFSEPPQLMRLYQGGWKNFVRVHAIKSRELDRLGFEGALARWERAVQERTIRLLWVTEHERFPHYIERLSRRIARLGMTLGQPSAPAPFENSYMVYLAIGAGFVSFIVLVLMSFLQLPVTALFFRGMIGMGALALLGWWDFELARQALASMIAVLAPWLLLLLCKEQLSGWKLLLAVALSSSGAGLAIAALLSDLPYFLKITEFRGVKLALIVPPVLIMLTELGRWRELGWNKLTTSRGAWLIPAVGLGLLFLVLERSGNLPAIPAARWEEFLRERLEDWLTARPRFKEFLVGHPALVLWKSGRNISQLGLLALGALGPASIINTFAHLHTPLGLSLWRTLNGLVLGLLIGVFLRFILLGVRRWRQRL